MRVEQGQLWLVTLDPVVANEQRGTRPCVVVSSERFNSMPIRQAIVVPLTTRERGLPHHVPVADGSGLTRTSWAMCEAMRPISLHRFGTLIGTLSRADLMVILDQVVLWFDQPAAT